MNRNRARWEHRLRSRLTTIKLALQMLRRNPELCRSPGGPAEMALEATDRLTEDVTKLTRARKTHSGE
jgi:hypothetical protein